MTNGSNKVKKDIFELLRYAASSALSALIDLGFYTLFSRVLLKNYVNTSYTLARFIGANFNFFANDRFVFKRGGKGRGARYVSYFALALVLMAAGNGLVALLHRRFGVHDIVAKLATDLSLFAVSFLVQKLIIFKKRSKKP